MTTPDQITAAARALADHNADVCNVNREDNWNIYGDSFRETAKVALEAAMAVPTVDAGAHSVLCAALKGLANHVRACGAYEKLRGDMEFVDQAIAALSASTEAAGEPVAWRIEHRPGRYTFTEHEENLKLDAGANIVPLYRAFHSVDAILESTLDRLESMVTWEPRLLAGPDATDRLEHINRLLYELLNPHPDAPPAASTEAAAGEPVAIYHGNGIIDCGDSGHHNLELLKMIPAGSKLYTAPPAAKLSTETVHNPVDRLTGAVALLREAADEDAGGYALGRDWHERVRALLTDSTTASDKE